MALSQPDVNRVSADDMKQQKWVPVVVVGIAMTLMVGAAFATGGDNTFGTATTGPLGTMQGWLQGSMGKMFAIGALAVGLGIGIVQQSVMSVAVGTGISLAASAGPTVLSTIFGSGI